MLCSSSAPHFNALFSSLHNLFLLRSLPFFFFFFKVVQSKSHRIISQMSFFSNQSKSSKFNLTGTDLKVCVRLLQRLDITFYFQITAPRRLATLINIYDRYLMAFIGRLISPWLIASFHKMCCTLIDTDYSLNAQIGDYYLNLFWYQGYFLHGVETNSL